jgi:hypothetical protein
MENARELVTVEHTLRQIVNVKGSKREGRRRRVRRDSSLPVRAVPGGIDR